MIADLSPSDIVLPTRDYHRGSRIVSLSARRDFRGLLAMVRSFKEEWLERIQVPLRRESMRREVARHIFWFDNSRPHQGLDGRTPHDVYENLPPARKDNPPSEGSPPTKLVVRFHDGRKLLPIVELKQAA